MSLHLQDRLQDRLFHEFTQSKQDRERRKCLCLHIPEYRSTSIRADSQQYNARLAVVEILQPVLFSFGKSSHVCGLMRSEWGQWLLSERPCDGVLERIANNRIYYNINRNQLAIIFRNILRFQPVSQQRGPVRNRACPRRGRSGRRSGL